MIMKACRLLVKAIAPVISIILILAGVILLRAQFWVAGAACIFLAIGAVILSIRVLENSPFTPEELEILRPMVLPATIWTIIISLLIISVFYVADNSESAETNRIAAGAWISSVILGLLVVAWKKREWSHEGGTLLAKIKANHIELMVLLLILMLAFALRTIALSTHPYPWSGDEASIGSEAMRIINGDVTNFFATGWSSQPNWSFVPTAITQIIFGKNILAIRLTSVLAGTLAVLFTYLTGRELFNPTIALMAAAFLATLPYNLHFSRIGVNNVIDSLMSALVFWLLAKALRKDDPRWYYVTGAVAGLCIYTYAGTRLVAILGATTLLFLAIRQRGYLYTHWRHLAAFGIAGVVSAAPQAAFFARHPDIFIGRLGQEGILFNGWLTQHSIETGKSVFAILLDQFTRTTMVFIAAPASGIFFNSPYPYLTVLGSLLFLLGMAYALAYPFKTQHFILLLWFWAVVLLGGILTLNPPANTRLVMTTPAVVSLMALGSFKIIEYLQIYQLMPARVGVLILAAVVGIIAYQNISFYMFEYPARAYEQDSNSEYAMEVGLLVKQKGEDLQIFVLGAPRIFSDFPTLEFIAPNNPRSNLSAEDVPTLRLTQGQKVGFFAIPENSSLLAEIRQMYPNGESGLVHRKFEPDEVLFEYYILEPTKGL
jgi:4-amino-4-deoxy-L-arabinose transferase-like glycosyltransferase